MSKSKTNKLKMHYTVHYLILNNKITECVNVICVNTAIYTLTKKITI